MGEEKKKLHIYWIFKYLITIPLWLIRITSLQINIVNIYIDNSFLNFSLILLWSSLGWTHLSSNKGSLKERVLQNSSRTANKKMIHGAEIFSEIFWALTVWLGLVRLFKFHRIILSFVAFHSFRPDEDHTNQKKM